MTRLDTARHSRDSLTDTLADKENKIHSRAGEMKISPAFFYMMIGFYTETIVYIQFS